MIFYSIQNWLFSNKIHLCYANGAVKKNCNDSNKVLYSLICLQYKNQTNNINWIHFVGVDVCVYIVDCMSLSVASPKVGLIASN